MLARRRGCRAVDWDLGRHRLRHVGMPGSCHPGGLIACYHRESLGNDKM